MPMSCHLRGRCTAKSRGLFDVTSFSSSSSSSSRVYDSESTPPAPLNATRDEAAATTATSLLENVQVQQVYCFL